MAYTPTVWQTGDTITAEKLNKLENGVANTGGYDIVFTKTMDGMTADGASVEELASGGYKKAIMVNIANMNESIGFLSLDVPNRSVVSFDFFIPSVGHPMHNIGLLTDGTYQYSQQDIGGEPNTQTGTYTYSNGHYVFTPEESGD